MRELKRTKLIAIGMLMLCSVILLVNLGTAMAAIGAGYDITEWFSVNTTTIDGRWTTADEWHESTTQRMGTPQVAIFEYKMDSAAGYQMTFLIEFADNTNDAGDKWQICFDGGAAGGAAPTTMSNKFEITGHTTLTTFVGTGTAWASMTNPTVTWSNTIATSSPHDPSPHWILELQFDKAQFADWGGSPPPQGLRIAMYDASNAAQGWVAWPPTSTDTNPTSYGAISTYDTAMGPAPEGLTIGVMVLLSSVAVLVGTRYFRKRP